MRDLSEQVLIAVEEAIVDATRPFTLHKRAFRDRSCGQQLLCLRGLLGQGVLEHFFEKRYGADYGIDVKHAGRTRMAVPFRASNEPAERDEFCQPDVCITLTHLAYYYKGLDKREIVQAAGALLHLPPSR